MYVCFSQAIWQLDIQSAFNHEVNSESAVCTKDYALVFKRTCKLLAEQKQINFVGILKAATPTITIAKIHTHPSDLIMHAENQNHFPHPELEVQVPSITQETWSIPGVSVD